MLAPEKYLTVDFVKVNFANLVNHFVVVEGDESESSVPVGHLVVGEHCVLYLAELFEVGFDILKTRGGRKAAHEYFLGAHHQFRVCLPGHGYLGLYDLTVELMDRETENLKSIIFYIFGNDYNLPRLAMH